MKKYIFRCGLILLVNFAVKKIFFKSAKNLPGASSWVHAITQDYKKHNFPYTCLSVPESICIDNASYMITPPNPIPSLLAYWYNSCFIPLIIVRECFPYFLGVLIIYFLVRFLMSRISYLINFCFFHVLCYMQKLIHQTMEITFIQVNDLRSKYLFQKFFSRLSRRTSSLCKWFQRVLRYIVIFFASYGEATRAFGSVFFPNVLDLYH
jgi:hypothetical protein